MNNKLIMTALLTMAVTTVSAQRLSVQETTIDVGRTGYETPVTATFELRNKGLRKLKIENVVPDCNCTKIEYPREEIGMGDKFTIRMTYDARQLGHFNKQAAIISNGSKKPVYLTMTGVVLADLRDYSGSYPYDFNGLLADADNLEFDNVTKGEERTAEVLIMNNGNHPMQPNVLHLPSYLSAKAYPDKLLPGRSGKMVFTLHSGKIRDYGLTQSTVYMAQRYGEKVKNETAVDVSAVLIPPVAQVANAPLLELSDSVLDITFGGKKKRSGVIELVNNGQSRLDISSLQMFTRGLSVTLSKRRLQPGEKTKLKITATAAELKKARSKPRVLMITNDPRNAKVIIRVNVQP